MINISSSGSIYILCEIVHVYFFFISSDLLVKWNTLCLPEDYFYLNLFKLYIPSRKASQLQSHLLFQESHELRTGNKSHFRLDNAFTVSLSVY